MLRTDTATIPMLALPWKLTSVWVFLVAAFQSKLATMPDKHSDKMGMWQAA
jgi:hypothetical protein